MRTSRLCSSVRGNRCTSGEHEKKRKEATVEERVMDYAKET